MISVSSSDVRNEIGLGFGGIEEAMMEDSDFEEDSIHSFVSCVDPDVALSYIDEKLENVLGHFQKDFEGGVSAENLGAKYGGYGSFLSMYQRSPLCKSPPEVQHQVVSRSKCSASSAVPQVSVSGSTSKPPPASDVLVKLKNVVKSNDKGTPDSKQNSVTKPSSSAPLNHKTLRLRIKVGSSDLSSPKNVSAYNNKQGLNMPPSTSRMNCLSEVEEGLLNEIHDSPTKILMAMVSFPLRKDELLSPLSDDLIQLGKKEKITTESDSKNKHDISDVQRCVGKFSTGKKDKLKERVKYMPQSNRLNGNRIVADSEKEADKQSCEELVSKTLKLPLLSCPSPSYNHPAKEIDKIADSYVEDVEDTLRGTNTDLDVVGKFQEDIGGSEDVYEGFFGDSGGSKEQEQSSLVLTAKKEKLSEENALNESFNNVRNDEDACKHLRLVCEPDSKHSIKSRNLNEDGHNTKQSVRLEVKNQHSVEGAMESLGGGPERELSGTYKKPKTGKSRFSSVDQPGSNKTLDGVNKTMTTQASAHKVKDIAKASLHDGHEDRKRKQEEHKVSRDCMRLEEAVVKESSGEKARKKKRHKGSSCDGKELPFSNKSCDRDRGRSQENGRDSASPNLLCKDLRSGVIKTTVHEAKGFLVESLAPSALDPREFKSGRNSEGDEHHDTDSSAGDTLKRCRDDEGYSTMDNQGATKKAAESSKDNNLLITGQATHSCDKERGPGENSSIEKYKPKKSGRYPGDNCTDGESQRKNREGSAPSKENNRLKVNEVQDLGTAVEIITKEIRSKKGPTRKVSVESNKEGSREYQGPNTKLDTNGCLFPSPQKSDRTKTIRGKNNHLEVTAEKLKNKSSPPAGTDQVEVLVHGTEISNTKKQMMGNDNHSVTHDVGSRNQKQNGSMRKDDVSSSPLKKESTCQTASNSMKEAADLKHMADRLMNAGSNHESTGLYFQAALKFLHGASLLESSGTEHATHKSIARSNDIYGSTAKLCEFCAHEYEKNKDMGAAALAYKCMEVAYLRITYSSHGNINRYGSELQAALQVIPSGESPSFASDGEKPNQTVAAEKVALSNTVRSSPGVTGNHVLSSGNNSSLSKLLAFSQNVSFAMEASRKAQMAFSVAKGKSCGTQYTSNGITSIKRALDFDFQDMEKLLLVVRLAMESINM